MTNPVGSAGSASFIASGSGRLGRFRPDIDGLRAVAVLAVIFFHFDIAPFSGGFVGVDVFFVISGYLITSIGADELRQNRFSLLAFYERRVRRIAPALLVMVLVCAAASPFVMLPGDLRLAGSGLTGAAVYTSNILFYSIANDYFASDNLSLVPALHSWSLSVEAQFYLLYPLLLLWLHRRGWPAGPVLAGLAALSLAGAIWGVFRAPSAAFYLLPPRAWELLLGGLLALERRRPDDGRLMMRGQAALGIGAILLAVFAFSRLMPFPGAAALLPCCGAALVIRAGSGAKGASALTGLLSTKPLAFAGRISYSLYLWHWPLLVFVGYGRPSPLGLPARVLLIVSCFALATLSWRLVERPFIERRLLRSRRALWVGAASGTALAVAAGVGVEQAGRGLFSLALLPSTVLTLANGQFDVITGDCRPETSAAATGPPCRFGSADAAPSVVLWGNSYARMWTPTLDIDAKRHDAAGMSLLLSKCLPVLGTPFPATADCGAFNAAALDYIRAHPALKTVILGANWFAGGPQLTSLRETLSKLRDLDVKVFVLLAPPQALYAVPRTLAMAALRHEPPPPPPLEAQAREAQKESTDIIEALRQEFDFGVIDPADALCDGVHCAVERDGHALYFDYGHVTVYAARNSAGLFDRVFTP